MGERARGRTILARAPGLLGALLATCLVVGFTASARDDTRADFEDQPAGTVLTGQYADVGGTGQGVVFGPLPAGTGVGEGLHPVVRTPPPGEAQSGSNVADIATCVGCEFFVPRTTGTFAVPRSQVSVYVGYLGPAGICTSVDPDSSGCAFVKLRVFDAGGNELAQSSVRVTRGGGIHSRISVSTPSATIVGFEISGRPTIDDSKPIAIDDLTFGTPAPPPPAPDPDFTLNPAGSGFTVEQGGNVTDAVTIGRLNGSTGDIAFRADGLPAGVDANFAPNPAPGSQTVLTLSAGADAFVGSATMTITGTPQAATAGPSPRSFTVNLVVQKACPQVRTASELVGKLAAGFKCIFVVGTINLDRADDLASDVFGRGDLTDYESILRIPEGVTLMGGRSPNFFGGQLELTDRIDRPVRVDNRYEFKKYMLHLLSNTRITGLRLKGYNQGYTKDVGDKTRAIAVNGSTGVLVDNNEIYGWPHSGVYVTDFPDHQVAPRITGNFIHNNVECNEGQGVQFGSDGFALVDRNVFNYNRHDVAGVGQAEGYIAELNFSLTSGPTCYPDDLKPDHYNQHYDMHGTGDGGYGGRAASSIEIRSNTIRGAQTYYAVQRRPAFWLRGTPAVKAVFVGNAVPHGEQFGDAGAVRVKNAGVTSDDLIKRKKLFVEGNHLCVDTAKELALGDFNGDGRDDVFQAVGTLWVYSPGGLREWFFLNGSTLRLRKLGLGDFDGDGKTDVFTVDRGKWRVSSGGTGPLRPLPAGSSIDIGQYRFADFDGDRKTDVFRTNGSQFFLSSGGATTWQPLAASRLPIAELRFGDFDGNGRTDVFSLANNQWSVSDGGKTAWRRLNKKLSSNLGSLVFADFNGDRKTDVARTNGGKWEVSWGGATAWQTLAFGRSEPLSVGMLFGDFDGDGRDDVLQHAKAILAPSLGCLAVRGGSERFKSLERFRLSPGGSSPLKPWSVANMR